MGRWTDESLITAAREWAAEHGHSPSTRDWIQSGPSSLHAVWGRWSRWSEFLAAANLPAPPPQAAHWTPARAIAAIVAFHAKHGRHPRGEDFTKAQGLPNRATVTRLFGTVTLALEAAGTPRPDPWRENNAILKALQADAKRRGRPPSVVDWAKGRKSHPSATTVAARFGGWRPALVEAGLTPRGRMAPWSEREVVEALQAWHDAHGRWPIKADWKCGAPDRPTAATAARVCGGWDAAVWKARHGDG